MTNVLSYSVTVDSTLVSSADYEPAKKKLSVLLKGGASYIYSGVSKIMFDKFVASKSKGEFFNQKIKNKYKFKRV